MLNIIDLFSGAGGLTEGFRAKDMFNFICHIEMDKDACASLELRNIYYYLKNQDNLNYYFDYIQGTVSKEDLYSSLPKSLNEDILNLEISECTIPLIFDLIDNKLNGKNLDGIIGGPPCQAYSTVGRAKNQNKKPNDHRIYLYKHYLDFLKKYEPMFFVFENVKGLLSFKDIKGELLFPKIIREFNEYGYDLEYHIINANDYGVSQKRERLFLIGYKKNLSISKSFIDCLTPYKENSPCLRELFSDLPKIRAGEICNHYCSTNNNEVVKKYIRGKNDNILTYNIARPHNDNDLSIYELVLKAKINGENKKYNDLPERMKTHSNTNSFLDRYKALNYDDVSHTVVAHISKDGHYYIHPDIKQNRSITVREAARIQGFPDNFYFKNSRTAAFRQIGNAVPPILSFKIAKAINDFLK